MISSKESTNTLKPVRVGLNEVFTGLEWKGEVVPVLSMFCCRFLRWAGWVMSAVEFDQAVQLDNSKFDEEGRQSMAGPGLSASYHLVWRHMEC